jgi:hypothetical protein
MICIPNERHFERNNRIRYKYHKYGFSYAELADIENLSISQITKITRAYPPLYVYRGIPRWMFLCEMLPGLNALFGTEKVSAGEVAGTHWRRMK